MAKQIIEEFGGDIKELIKNVTGIEEETEQFNQLYKRVTNKLRKSHVIQFVNKREVDQNVRGMADKFVFHNFPSQAEALQNYYDEYVNAATCSTDLSDRLNVVMFLIALSNRPTIKFLEHPEEFAIKDNKVDEQIIDWGQYLSEGIEKWEPKFDDTSESAYSSDDGDLEEEIKEIKVLKPPNIIESNTQLPIVVDFKSNRQELLNTIQHTWFNNEPYLDAPPSEHKEANIGIAWEEYLEKQTMCLIDIPKSNVLSEYKVIREILWQLWSPHSSAVFEFQGNDLKPRGNVTIASVRAVSFQNFLENKFIPYIEVMNTLRDFSKLVEENQDNEENFKPIPGTYRSYNSSLQNMIGPVYQRLVELEEQIREQEVTYTLLDLSKDLNSIMEPVFLCDKIHKEVITDFTTNTSLQCATTLLTRLHSGLQFAENKMELDLRVTLYLESLYHYLTLINSWLVKNHLSDVSDDFIIKHVTINGVERFIVCADLEDSCKQDGIIRIISESVLQIGQNLDFLRQLGKHPFPNTTKVTIYEEFVGKSLEELRRFFGEQEDEISEVTTNQDVSTVVDNVTFPVICTEYCRKPINSDKLENIVDSIDGYLMLSLKDFFIKKPNVPLAKEQTLLEKISKITKSFFPVANFFDKILSRILRERFTISGLMVKSILIDEFLLEKQFQLLRHVFLFVDDIIFPFYRRLFEKANSNKWGNNIQLTSHLHDILIDIYPEFYERCSVQVDKNWELSLDGLHSCSMVCLNYEIIWPLNVIIKPQQMDMYESLFRTICKIKWALYALNHLYFTDLEPKGKQLRKHKLKVNRDFVKKLKFLKFSLTNLMNSIQHYIFSFVFMKALQKFELDFEKTYDLTSIIESHEQFIATLHSMVADIPKLQQVLLCVNDLDFAWNNIEASSPEKLNKIYISYKDALNAINPIICPVHILDY